LIVEFLNQINITLLLSQVAISGIIMFLGLPYLTKRTTKIMWRKLYGSKGGRLAVDGKVDKAILDRAVKDLMSNENPIGIMLNFFPSVKEYLKTNPSSVIGFIKLLDNVGNLTNLQKNLAGLEKNPSKVNFINSEYG